MASEVASWRVGDVTISRIPELVMEGFPPGHIIGGLTEDDVRAIPWLSPDYADEEGRIRISIHAFLIESQGQRILVDTCVGNDKPRCFDAFDQLETPFLRLLRDAGASPEDVTQVVCTHMHIDHVGWNTRWDGARWVPTFPHARYLFGRSEWEHWQETVKGLDGATDDMARDTVAIFADSILPIIDAGLHDLVEPTHAVTSEVRLFPTPGHTPGHVSVAIDSDGARAVITGDVFHHPAQLAKPDLGSVADSDPDLAGKTRQAFIRSHSGEEILVLGTHFAMPSGGHIVADEDAWRFASVVSGERAGTEC